MQTKSLVMDDMNSLTTILRLISFTSAIIAKVNIKTKGTQAISAKGRDLNFRDKKIIIKINTGYDSHNQAMTRAVVGLPDPGTPRIIKELRKRIG